MRRTVPSGLAEVRQDRVDEFEGLVDLLANFRSSEDDLAAYEDEQHNLRLHHTVNQTREQFGLVGREHVMTAGKTLKTNREFNVATADDVLNLEVREFGIEAKLLDDTCILATSKFAVILRLCTSDNHLATSEDQSSGLRLADTHNHGSETLWIVLSVTCVKGNRLQIEATVKVHRGDDVLKSRHNTRDTLSLLLPRRCGRRGGLLHVALWLAIRTIPVALRRLSILGIRRRGREVAGAAWVRQRIRARECRSFLRIVGVGDVRLLHDCG